MYPEETSLRRDLAGGIARARRAHDVKGDELIRLHDAQAGERAAKAMERDVAAQIATSFTGTPLEFCQAVKHRVPSAKPCRMAGPPGTRSKDAATALRGGDIEGWGIKRLLAVAGSLGYRAEIRLVEDPTLAARRRRVVASRATAAA